MTDPTAAPSASNGQDNPEFTITLPQSAWLTVAHFLGRAPYCEVAAILNAMTTQVNAQLRLSRAADEADTAQPAQPTPAIKPPATH